MRPLSLFLPLFLLLLTACYADELEEKTQLDPFFDLRGYMTQQIDSLTAARPLVTKTVILNGQEEEQVRDDVNFSTDLRAFREADINKPAWFDKYKTVKRDGVTLYEAQDSSLQTQRLLVQQQGGRTVQIDIVRKTGTLLSDGIQELTYRPASGYTIDTEQTNRFGGDVVASVSVYWE